MKFQRYLPSPPLAEDIECFILSEEAGADAYTVLPDLSIVMGFQYRGRLALLDGTGVRPLAPAGITGLQQEYRRFQPLGPTGTLLVRFRPGGFASYLKSPVHELAGQSLPLDLLAGGSHMAAVGEQLNEAATDGERIRVVEAFLLSCRKPCPPDPLVDAAAERIRRSGGLVRIDVLAKELCCSASPLEKRFRARIGCSPKKFARIVRLQAVVRSAKQEDGPAARAYEAGYFDQAHFIKDFRRFSGETPEAYFRCR